MKDRQLVPLSALYEYKSLDIAIQQQSEAIINLIKQMQCNIMLLPHVLSPNPQDNDLTYMRAIYDKIKLQYAYEQGGDLNAKQMLEYIGWLYGQEDSYRQSGLTAEEVTRQQNSLRTKEVIGRMRSFLNVLTSGASSSWRPDGKGGQLPEELLESAVRLLERRPLKYRQYYCGAFHPSLGW